MGQSIVEKTVSALRAAGIRAEAAYPGQKMPHLLSPAAAVSLHKVDWEEGTAAVKVTVASPMALGGTACENKAVDAVRALADIGGRCTASGVKYDSAADRFYAEVTAVFRGQENADGWADTPPAPVLTVKIGNAAVHGAQSLTAERKVNVQKVGAAGENAPAGTVYAEDLWKITLEQLEEPGEETVSAQTEPFTLTAERGNWHQIFTGCRWTESRWAADGKGLRRVRTGTAVSMEERIE